MNSKRTFCHDWMACSVGIIVLIQTFYTFIIYIVWKSALETQWYRGTPLKRTRHRRQWRISMVSCRGKKVGFLWGPCYRHWVCNWSRVVESVAVTESKDLSPQRGYRICNCCRTVSFCQIANTGKLLVWYSPASYCKLHVWVRILAIRSCLQQSSLM